MDSQDGVIQKDEFMQALFNTQPGNGNLFADRVRTLCDSGLRDSRLRIRCEAALCEWL